MSWKLKQGKLYKGPSGRWNVDYLVNEDVYTDEYTCGEGVQVWTRDGWLPGRFEAIDGEYYIILQNGLQFFPMRGTLVRRPE